MSFRDKLEGILGEKKGEAKELLDALDKTLDGYATDIDDLKKKLRKTADISPETVVELEKEVQTLKTEKKELSDKLKTAEKTAAEATEKLGLESRAVRDLVIDQGLTEHLTKLKIPAAQLPAVKALLEKRLTVESDGSTRKAIAKFLDKDNKELTAPLAEYIEKHWANSDEGKAFTPASQNGGGGSSYTPGQGGAGKTKTQTEVDALGPKDKAAFFADGGSVVE